MSANNSNNTDNKDYRKVEMKTRPYRSSSLTLLLQQDRSSRPALQSADAANLESNGAETNVATGMDLVVGTWKKEDRIPPRPSQAGVKKSGFEMEAAKEIIEKFGDGVIDPETEGVGDEDVDGEKNGVTIPRC